jgi:hypothetical protein
MVKTSAAVQATVNANTLLNRRMRDSEWEEGAPAG